MKARLLLIALLCSGLLQAQEVVQRLILIGDAGEINEEQQRLIPAAAALVLPGKTRTYFLGDNVYPVGMGLTGPARQVAADILRAQFTPFRQLDVPVYFMAGNHDWDKSGPDGYAKIKAQEAFIKQQDDPDLHFIPPAGSLGPFVEELTDSVVAISYDSEFWLFPHHPKTARQAIAAEKQAFLQALDSLATVYHDKQLLLLSHHPMRSYGEHSLYFSVNDHLFPLRKFWKGLYIPLPVLGSAYPWIRSTLLRTAEDRKDPLYRGLIDSVQAALLGHPRVLYISGHDHGLQLIQRDGLTQIVSGSGAKTSAIRKGPGLQYRYGKQGFTLVDLLVDGRIRIGFYMVDKNQVRKDFEGLLNQTDFSLIP